MRLDRRKQPSLLTDVCVSPAARVRLVKAMQIHVRAQQGGSFFFSLSPRSRLSDRIGDAYLSSSSARVLLSRRIDGIPTA